MEFTQNRAQIVDAQEKQSKLLLKSNELSETIEKQQNFLDKINKVIQKNKDDNIDITSSSLERELTNKLRERQETQKRLVQKISHLQILYTQLLDTQKNKTELGLVDSVFEAISGILTDQITSIEENIAKGKDSIAKTEQELYVQDNSINAKKIELQNTKKEDKLTKDKNLDLLLLQSNDLVSTIKDLEAQKSILSDNEQTVIANIKELERKNTILLEKVETLKKEKETSQDTDTLKENGSAPARKIQVIKLLKEGKASIQSIVKALIAVHNETNQKKIENEEVISNIINLAKSSSVKMIEDVKITYEDLLARENQGISLIYNKDNVRVTDPILNNKIQCYSGTLLFNAINELSEKAFKNTVVIFTAGHVLPGYIEQKGSELYLKGIESTAEGRAIINYRQTKDIKGDIRVFDAKQFLLAELLKDETANARDLYNQMLKSVKRYGVNTENFMPLDDSKSTSSNTQLNSTMFAFGTANVPSGDQTREVFEEQDNTNYRIIPVDKVGPVEEEYYGYLPKCRSIKHTDGTKSVLNVDVECLNDNQQIINLSSYQSVGFSNSASVSYYAKDGSTQLSNVILDNFNNYSACQTTETGRSNSANISMDLNLNLFNQSIDQLFMELQQVEKTSSSPESMITPTYLAYSIRMNSENEVLYKLFNSTVANKVIEIPSSELDLSIELEEKRKFSANTEEKCKISIKNQKTLTYTGSLEYLMPIDSNQITIEYPSMISESGEEIKDVNVKVNCGISKMTYHYNQ